MKEPDVEFEVRKEVNEVMKMFQAIGIAKKLRYLYLYIYFIYIYFTLTNSLTHLLYLSLDQIDGRCECKCPEFLERRSSPTPANPCQLGRKCYSLYSGITFLFFSFFLSFFVLFLFCFSIPTLVYDGMIPSTIAAR